MLLKPDIETSVRMLRKRRTPLKKGPLGHEFAQGGGGLVGEGGKTSAVGRVHSR